MLWHAGDFSHAATVRNRDAETAGKTPVPARIKDLTDWPGRNKQVQPVAAMDRPVSVSYLLIERWGQDRADGKVSRGREGGAPAR